MYTTLNKIREHSFRKGGWEKLLNALGKKCADDEPMSILTVLDSSGLEDALWCLRKVEGHDREIRLLAVHYARAVQHQLARPGSIRALDVAEMFANGQASAEELESAAAAAQTADAWASAHAWAVAAVVAAADANVAWAVAGAAWAARTAVETDAVREAQAAELRRIIERR